MSLVKKDNLMKSLRNIVLVLTAWSLLQGIAVGGFIVVKKIITKFETLTHHQNKFEEIKKEHAEYEKEIDDRFAEIEKTIIEQGKIIKYLKGKANGFEKVMREDMEIPVKKKRKKKFGIF